MPQGLFLSSHSWVTMGRYDKIILLISLNTYHIYKGFQSGWQDLNLRHPAPKAGALPSCATSRYTARLL